MLYLWIKAFHIIAVIAWMAGMLYLPRLFVYHCAAEKGSVQSETFKVMERRLLRAIINPAMIAAVVLGLWLGWMGPDSRFGWFASGWLHAKIVLVEIRRDTIRNQDQRVTNVEPSIWNQPLLASAGENQVGVATEGADW